MRYESSVQSAVSLPKQPLKYREDSLKIKVNNNNNK